MCMDDYEEKSEIEKEKEEGFRLFSEITNKELETVNSFDPSDVDELFSMIFENLKDLEDLEIALGIMKDKVMMSQDIKYRLNYQLHLTKKDIFEENLINIYLVYNAVVLGIWLTSPTVIEFLKRLLIVGIIGVASYDLNARYFASDNRKEKAKITIDEIDKYLEISRYDIGNINKFRDIYIETLKTELNKLAEITYDGQLDIERKMIKMNKLLCELNLEYLLRDTKVKKRIK